MQVKIHKKEEDEGNMPYCEENNKIIVCVLKELFV
jgi:hypothetical protein